MKKLAFISLLVLSNDLYNETRINTIQQKIDKLLSIAQQEVEHSKIYLQDLDGNKGSLSRPHRYNIKQSLTEILEILEQENMYDGQDDDEIRMINHKLEAIFKSEKPDNMSWDDYIRKKRQEVEVVINELRETFVVARENRVFICLYQELVSRITTHLIGCLSHDEWQHRQNLKDRYELVHNEKLENKFLRNYIDEHDCFTVLVPYHNNPVTIADVLKAYDQCKESVRKNWAAIEKDLKEKE